MLCSKKWIFFILMAVTASGPAQIRSMGNGEDPRSAQLLPGLGVTVLSRAVAGVADSNVMDSYDETEIGQTRSAADGPWGGDGIQLTIGTERSSIEYPCADGEIPGRFRLNRNGTFRLSGSHVRLRPGPVRPDKKDVREPAIFEGRVTGERMVLKVTLANSREIVGEFRLQKGAVARIRRCL